jgi:hypothetical protein
MNAVETPAPMRPPTLDARLEVRIGGATKADLARVAARRGIKTAELVRRELERLATGG